MAAPIFDGFDVGDTAVVTVDLSRDGEAVDGDVSCKLRWRNAAVVDVDGADISHEGDGVYKIRVACSKAGDWHVRVIASSGDDDGVEEFVVRVNQSAFVRT